MHRQWGMTKSWPPSSSSGRVGKCSLCDDGWMDGRDALTDVGGIMPVCRSRGRARSPVSPLRTPSQLLLLCDQRYFVNHKTRETRPMDKMHAGQLNLDVWLFHSLLKMITILRFLESCDFSRDGRGRVSVIRNSLLAASWSGGAQGRWKLFASSST